MAATTVWGVDIGNSAIKAVKMSRVGASACKVEDFDIVEIPGGDDEKDRAARLEAALRDLTKNHRFGKDPVWIAVTGNICLHREFQLPPGSDDKLAELVQYEAKQQIPFPLDQVEWGYERYEDPGGIGVALIAVRKNDIQELLALTDKCQLNVRGITASPMSLFNFVHYEFQPNNTTLILDAGAKGTDFVVMNKRQIYFRSIQIAGREITRALENKFKVPFAKAEELKKNISQSPQKDKILSVIEPTLRQLGAEIQRTIGFYKSKARGQRIQQAYLLGHTFRLPTMAETLQAQVREAPFAIVEGLQRVKIDNGLNAEVWNNEFPTMAVAIGLGLQGLGMSELKLNLLPEDRRETEISASRQIWALASAAVVLVALGVGYIQETKFRDSYAARLKDLETKTEELNKHRVEEQKVTAGLQQKKDLLERMGRIAHDRGKTVQAFSKVINLPVFGGENKTYITNIYVSRIPVPTVAGNDVLPDSARQQALAKSSNLIGEGSLYAKLAKSVDPATQPPELRPDAPMSIIISGEIQGDESTVRRQLMEIETALKGIAEIKDVRTNDHMLSARSYAEQKLMYTWDGKLVQTGTMGRDNASQDKVETQYAVFHAICRWEDPTDPDTEPVLETKDNKAGKGK